MSDEFDRQGLSAMVDYWISPAAVKREFEATKSKYSNGTNGRFCFPFPNQIWMRNCYCPASAGHAYPFRSFLLTTEFLLLLLFVSCQASRPRLCERKL